MNLVFNDIDIDKMVLILIYDTALSQSVFVVFKYDPAGSGSGS